MISKVLVANRGEIAVRVIRACKELGIKTVAIYSDADKEAMHTQLADEAICVGAGKSKDSYLNEINIISAAVTTKCNAIHPGFGFLSENAEFASICEECNIKFIGPSSETMSIMGNKSRARDIMKSAGVPVVPGSDGVVATYEDAMVEARKIGFPLMIKASAGGGGKGIRLVRKFEELENAYNTAKSEAKNNFNDDSVYMEKFIEICDYIGAHCSEDLNLETISHMSGFSKFHFSRLFKEYTDYNFSDYLCIRRIKAAEALLEDPDYSITEVALNSGFASISTFNRIFKQKKGITPSEYRKRCTSPNSRPVD